MTKDIYPKAPGSALIEPYVAEARRLRAMTCARLARKGWHATARLFGAGH